MSSSARNRSYRSAGASPSVALQRQGRPVSLATCHGNEHALARPFLVALGLVIHEQLPAHRTNFTHCHVDASTALGETDMGAHLNSTRLAAILPLAFRLVRRIARACPGWGQVELRRRDGLQRADPDHCLSCIHKGAHGPRQPQRSPYHEPLPKAIKPISSANRSPDQAGWGRS